MSNCSENDGANVANTNIKKSRDSALLTQSLPDMESAAKPMTKKEVFQWAQWIEKTPAVITIGDIKKIWCERKGIDFNSVVIRPEPNRYNVKSLKDHLTTVQLKDRGIEVLCVYIVDKAKS
jgi:hypothetical protein